jgi:hypothetical protein
VHQLVDGTAKGARIAEQRGDVAKENPVFRIVGTTPCPKTSFAPPRRNPTFLPAESGRGKRLEQPKPTGATLVGSPARRLSILFESGMMQTAGLRNSTFRRLCAHWTSTDRAMRVSAISARARNRCLIVATIVTIANGS